MMKAGDVKVWLDQGPAVLLEQCDIEEHAIACSEVDDVAVTTEKGWVIHLLLTNELLTVHEETLCHGGCDD